MFLYRMYFENTGSIGDLGKEPQKFRASNGPILIHTGEGQQ